jgi:hypothetical protein
MRQMCTDVVYMPIRVHPISVGRFALARPSCVPCPMVWLASLSDIISPSRRATRNTTASVVR